MKLTTSRRNYTNSDGSTNYNSAFSEKVEKTLSNNFTLSDIDTAILHFAAVDRLIIAETKRSGEKPTNGQSYILSRLKHDFHWERYDDESGVFVIQENENPWISVNIYVWPQIDEPIMTNVPFERLDDWFSGKKFMKGGYLCQEGR